MRALLDTSALIGIERRDLVLPPIGRAFVAAMTIGELAMGAAAADDADEYAIRRHTLLRVRERFDVIALTGDIAERYGELVARLRRDGLRPPTADSLIAATAMSEGLPVVTQDADFLAFEEHGLDVILV